MLFKRYYETREKSSGVVPHACVGLEGNSVGVVDITIPTLDPCGFPGSWVPYSYKYNPLHVSRRR
ncbi:hypothetical protein OTSANNIE_0349 [Anaplasma phagocytophilum str. Annie]|uniref:Surface antigen family protein n=1 Tax=Anaplasma phagocytophilum str. NCH-1 TaxID=1359161 RepID=A0A0F3NJS1_ANAPH|nr:hypothetical protein EPHNCH_0384 [Anaplasma phagocytophilum str. NCH-1]KJV99489.1 hypothetical protein OTSANNIE_0368 [Anaplasma phagocytophilum str. Annie]KJV99723.1 hypothetical protein OTSANNIE_0349 [Anaplasma phagocytophilum str. Annie]